MSFYVKSSTPLELLNNPIGVSILGNIQLYDGFESRSVSFLNTHGDIIGTEWTLIKMSLDKSEIEAYLGDSIPKWIYFDLASTYYDLDNITISIDKVKVSYEKDATQAEPMPQSLLNYSGNDQILFVNIDKQVAATMKPNGSNLINYNTIKTNAITSLPYWYDNNTITVGQINFNPPTSNDATVISASQTQLNKYDLNSQNETLLYETLGNPGRYEFDGSVNNLDALDLEVRRAAWDAPRNRGAITVCGQNRSLSAVSDDYCRIYLIDKEGVVLNDITEGFNASWSASGRLAYVLHGAIYVGDVSGNTINATIIYEKVGVSDVVDWSPDGNNLVFMERGGDTVGSVYAQAIKTLNITTGKVTELVLVDQGNAYPNVSWSNDGNFIIYSLFIPSKSDPSLGNNQIWWLEVSTRKTGPITNTMNAFGGTFLK